MMVTYLKLWLLLSVSSVAFSGNDGVKHGANFQVFTGKNEQACEKIASYANAISNSAYVVSNSAYVVMPIEAVEKRMGAIRWKEVHYDIDMNNDGRSEYVVVVSPYMGGELHSGDVLIGHSKNDIVRKDAQEQLTLDESGYPSKAPIVHRAMRYMLSEKYGPYSRIDPSAKEIFFDDPEIGLVKVFGEVYMVQFERDAASTTCDGEDDCMELYGIGLKLSKKNELELDCIIKNHLK